jgi:hypothetical protein
MDYVLGFLAIAAFVAFTSVIAIFVPSWDLVVVLALCSLMAAWDFWLTLRRRRSEGPDRIR